MIKSNNPETEAYVFATVGIVCLFIAFHLIPFLAVPATIAFARSLMLTFHPKIKGLSFAPRLCVAMALGLVASVWLLLAPR